jgi:osmotically-inducible protein OsmY
LLRVEVSVEQGVVYLSGETDDAQQNEAREQIARRISCGAQVVNKVLVEP